MKYFSNFPIITYDKNLSIDITSRYKALDSVLQKVQVFYDYIVKDGETPHTISHKFYDKYDHHDLIMLFNKLHDPYFEWPLTYDQFGKYIEKKYGSEQYAKQTVKHYYHIISDGRIVDNQRTPIIKNIISYETYITLDDFERDLIYIYDYENDLNEKRRQIKIIDSIYIPQILREKDKIFS